MKFNLLDDETIKKRETEWSIYEGDPIEMRHGFSLRLRPKCEYSRRRFVYRIAEPQEIDFLISSFSNDQKQNWVCVDAGANVGYWSKILAEVIRVKKVFSFEPEPETFKLLESNLGQSKNTELLQLALSSKCGTLQLYVDPRDTGDSTSLCIDGRMAFEVPALSLDEFVSRRNLKRLDFVKVDIQGGEIDFFKGAQQAIDRLRPILLVEVMSNVYDGIGRFVAEFAQKNKYNICIISETGPRFTDPADFQEFLGSSNVFLTPFGS
jgi:FkbM family methyltransferase